MMTYLLPRHNARRVYDRVLKCGVLLAAALAAGGCQHATTTEMPQTPPLSPMIQVPSVAAPLSRNDPAWNDIPAHHLTLNDTQIKNGLTPLEPGRFRIAHDDTALYLKFELTDRDINASAKADGQELFSSGDVVEWFIGTPPRPNPDPNAGLLPGVYWEFHVAPNGVRTAYHYTRPGLYLVSEHLPFEAEVAVDGTLNQFADTDRSWSAQMTLPWSELDALDPHLTENQNLRAHLTMLVGRYNYGHHLPYAPNGNPKPELTMWPPQPRTAFHLRQYHAPLQLLHAPVRHDVR